MNIAAHIDTHISATRLIQNLCEMINIASPTGEERPLARWLAEIMDENELDGQVQAFGSTQANAIGHLSGRNGDKNLLLYAPIDTVTSNSELEDLPWASRHPRTDLKAAAVEKDGHVFGLGAHNPKGHGACILEAARVLRDLQIELPGNVYFGFGAGGMPTHSRKEFESGTGHGIGCAQMIEHLPKLDGAIIAKSGTSVTWAEVGFIWLRVTVSGQHNYVGARHLMPYSNAIANAAKLILRLEDWFETYAETHASDTCRPQGTISHMQSGWERMPAFTPAAAQFLIDLRFTPDQSADEVEAEFSDFLRQASIDLGIDTEYTRIQTIDASQTSVQDPIIQSTVNVWEKLHGRAHEPFTIMSGATDANILRQHGIPTARIGLAKADLPDMDFALGMNSVAISELRQLTKFLVMSVLHYFGRLTDG